VEIGGIDFHHFHSFSAPGDARAPNQGNGLACADQGHPRATLDVGGLLGAFFAA